MSICSPESLAISIPRTPMKSLPARPQFGGRIAHGILGAGFISAVLGMKLPGPGTIYLGQELKFTKPVYIGDTVTASCTVREILSEKNIVKLETICTNQHGDIVIKGMATAMPPKTTEKA